ncbi:hypothetical protein [Micromonospora globbae]|uniref:hypothetical protein n=1 Tax=Micromonospora globbae TaxID=1894969 RepID=UPI003867B8FC|nr:hypothetical protein OH732_05970 [Micromonospora globbae]
MRDDLRFVERVRRELRDVRWPPPEEIRAVARRRTRRNVVVATVLLALAGGSAVAFVAPGPAPAPPAAASATPGVPPRTEITPDALLQSADLPQRTTVELSESGLGGDVVVSSQLTACRTDQGLPASLVTAGLSRSQALLRERPGGGENRLSDILVVQEVYRLTPEEARTFFTDLDAMLAPCAQWRSRGPYEAKGRTGTAEAVHRWQVVRRGFAGDDAAVLRHSVSPPRDVATGRTVGDASAPTDTAVVRVGDLITVLFLKQGTEAELIQLAGVAARRMCLAANPGC